MKLPVTGSCRFIGSKLKLPVTGSCGFIGSNFIRYMLKKYPDYQIINLDKLTYDGNPANLKDLENNPNCSFVKGDIYDPVIVNEVMKKVDRLSVVQPKPMLAAQLKMAQSSSRQTCLVQTFFSRAPLQTRSKKFIHISTDEVYRSTMEGSFIETDKLNPVINGQFGKHTYPMDLANKIREIIELNLGIYHITNDGINLFLV